MIVGEASGEQEDMFGMLLVGHVGQLLNKIFKSGAYDIDTQIFFSNVVKCRPLNNCDPTVVEIAYFLPHLHEKFVSSTLSLSFSLEVLLRRHSLDNMSGLRR